MRQRVLIIDDSRDIHELVIASLAGEGVEILSAFDGKSGLETARGTPPDLILLDVNMPDLDGFEVCQRLKTENLTSSIPVIFLTVAASTAEKVKALEFGGVDYITKPFDPAELRARARSALRTKFLIDQLAQRAKIDGLTGLWNRAFFEERLEAELSLARRTGRPVACMILDIDFFKQINDGYGHTAGDVALRALAQSLRANSRIEDVVCRFGGEEFIVLCPNTDSSAAMIAAERLRRIVAAMTPRCGGATIRMTCSIGVADIATSGESNLVNAADKALYEAKSGGRNQVCCARPAVPVAAK
ncbi:MAG: diguanylate cyclase [Tepidisphaeraceae bacterium]|jgi:diguanylate cyclase (GGDEF)-like protein